MTSNTIDNPNESSIKVVLCENAVQYLSLIFENIENFGKFHPIFESNNEEFYSNFIYINEVKISLESIYNSEKILSMNIEEQINFLNKLIPVRKLEEQIICYDHDPFWYLQAVYWAFQTQRRLLFVEKNILGHCFEKNLRNIFVGSPFIPKNLYVYRSTSDYALTQSFLTAINPFKLSLLLLRTRSYNPPKEVFEFSSLVHLNLLSPAIAKLNLGFSDDPSAANVQVERGGHSIFACGHGGLDYFHFNSLVFCGKQTKIINSPIENKFLEPVCATTGKCFAQAKENSQAAIWPLESLNFKHIVFIGCRTFNLGQNAMGLNYDLALAAVSGQAISYVGSYEYADADISFLLFLNALLMQGFSLGKALDFYINWNSKNVQGRSVFHLLGDPSLSYVKYQEHAVIPVSYETKSFKIYHNVRVVELKLDEIFRNINNFNFSVKSLQNQEVYYSFTELEGKKSVWIFGMQELLSGEYLIDFQCFPDFELAANRIANIFFEIPVLKHIKLLRQEGYSALKIFEEVKLEFTQKLAQTHRKVLNSDIFELKNKFNEKLLAFQQAILKPHISYMQRKQYNPLEGYELSRSYLSDWVEPCPSCFLTKRTSILLFPGITTKKRLRTQCSNCEVMEEFPEKSNFSLHVEIQKNSKDMQNVICKITNNSHIQAALTLIVLMDRAEEIKAKVKPEMQNLVLKEQSTCEKNFTVSSHLPNSVIQRYIYIFCLIDLEWFYYVHSMHRMI